jgi:hypothetical protein
MRIRTVVTTLLAASVLVGCSARGSRTGVGKLSPAAFSETGTGVVVLSVGAANSRVAYQTGVTVFDQATRRPVKPNIGIWVDSFAENSDFPTHHGTVNALRLPPGSYYLAPWRLSVTPRTTPTFEFDVHAGETTYAGELYMTWAGSREASFAIRDQYDRDVALAREKNPAIEARPVVKRLLRVGMPIE